MQNIDLSINNLSTQTAIFISLIQILKHTCVPCKPQRQDKVQFELWFTTDLKKPLRKKHPSSETKLKTKLNIDNEQFKQEKRQFKSLLNRNVLKIENNLITIVKENSKFIKGNV